MADDARKLYDRLVAEGGDPAEAAKFAGIDPPETTASGGAATDSPDPSRSTNRGRARLPSPRLPSLPTGRAQRIVFGVMVLTVGFMIVGDVLSGRGRVTDALPRRIVGGSIAGIMLMLLAVPAPRLAVGFAALSALGVVFLTDSGRDVLAGIARFGGEQTAPAPNGGDTVTASRPGNVNPI